MVVYTAIDLVEASSLAGSWDKLAHAYVFKLPSVLVHILPLAVLVGSQLTLASMRSSGQWDAMRSAGIAPTKLMSDLLVVPWGAVAVSVVFVTWIAPMGMSVWQARLDSDSSAVEHQRYGTAAWVVRDGTFIKHGEELELRIERSPDGLPMTRVETRKNVPDSPALVWRHGRGWQKEIRSKPSAETRSDALLLKAYSLSTKGMLGDSLSLPNLYTAISLAAKRGLNAAPLRAEAALRVALVAACIVLPLLCLGISIGRDSSAASGLVGIGIVAAAAYWLFLAVAWNSAVAGVLAPYWVYGVVPLVFAGGGTILAFVGAAKQT
jgi:lipopolysaccharide export LptBFGC system permease protein LptF